MVFLIFEDLSNSSYCSAPNSRQNGINRLLFTQTKQKCIELYSCLKAFGKRSPAFTVNLQYILLYLCGVRFIYLSKHFQVFWSQTSYHSRCLNQDTPEPGIEADVLMPTVYYELCFNLRDMYILMTCYSTPCCDYSGHNGQLRK